MNITYDDFKKLEMRVGTIKEVEPVEGTDKLLKCQIDFNETDEDGNKKMRQIVSGIREYFPEYKELEGKQALYVINLEPREIRGVMSHGMLMAVDGMNDAPVFLIPEEAVNSGSAVR